MVARGVVRACCAALSPPSSASACVRIRSSFPCKWQSLEKVLTLDSSSCWRQPSEPDSSGTCSARQPASLPMPEKCTHQALHIANLAHQLLSCPLWRGWSYYWCVFIAASYSLTHIEKVSRMWYQDCLDPKTQLQSTVRVGLQHLHKLKCNAQCLDWTATKW